MLLCQVVVADGNITIDDIQLAGVWANKVETYLTSHEFTVDFISIEPEWDRGIVVARVSFSPKLAFDIIKELSYIWHDFEQRSMPKEVSGEDN